MNSGASAPLFFGLFSWGLGRAELIENGAEVSNSLVRSEFTECSPVGFAASYADDIVFGEDSYRGGKGRDEFFNIGFFRNLDHDVHSIPSSSSNPRRFRSGTRSRA